MGPTQRVLLLVRNLIHEQKNLTHNAPEYLRNDPHVKQLIREFRTADKWMFAICHGIQVLISAGIAKGLRMTCYKHVCYEVEANGGTYVTEEAVRDGRVVTAQTWQSHPEFYRLVFACRDDG